MKGIFDHDTRLKYVDLDAFEQQSERKAYRYETIYRTEDSRVRELAIQYGVDPNEADYDSVAGELLSEAHLARRRDVDAQIQRWQRIYAADESGDYSTLAHDEFCDTAYWLWLAKCLKIQANYKCGDCSQQFEFGSGLEVHHKTYKHFGDEYPNHLTDLVVLCGPCHGRRHGKISAKEYKTHGL